MNHPHTYPDPILHTAQCDVLDESHPWHERTVYCAGCRAMLHAGNNECMRPWVEYEKVALCAKCAAPFLVDLYSVWCFLKDDGTPKSMEGCVR